MPRKKRPTDMNQLGKLVVDMATGQVPSPPWRVLK